MDTEIFGKYISAQDIVIAAISGGPDSTTLIHLLSDFLKKTRCKIIVAHVNHGIRGREADKDEKFVEGLARSFGFPYEIKRVNLSGSGLEERGREIRRLFFEELRKKYSAKWIITAHTQDDQLETVIFNFIRGAGVSGLAGMQVADGFYLKPLLNAPKSEIFKYLKAKKLKFCVDKTNKDPRFSRNFIRRKLLPLFLKLNPSLRDTLLRNSEIFRDLKQWLLSESEQFLAAQKKIFKGKQHVFLAKDFLKLPEPVCQMVINLVFQKYTGQYYGLSFIKTEEIIGMIKKNVGRKRICVNKDCYFYLNKGVVLIF